MDKNHNYYMAKAIKLAKKARYSVKSNPLVGCIIIKDHNIIATGYHKKDGEDHAEIDALKKINFKAENCTMYITLEPCSHFGKTPPCVNVIIKSKIKDIIIATVDPNPQVSSIHLLKQANINVVVNILTTDARKLNRGFFKRMQEHLPFVSCKIACSIDGRTALHNGCSKWITNESSREDVHKLRAQQGAIITGSQTVITDNPHFNIRINLNDMLPPIKIIMDRSNNIVDKSLNIFTGAKAIITNKKPQELLFMLNDMGINNVLIEAGSTINGVFLKQNLIDELIIYMAPVIMGSHAKSMFNMIIENMNNKISLDIKSIHNIDTDIKIIAKPLCKN